MRNMLIAAAAAAALAACQTTPGDAAPAAATPPLAAAAAVAPAMTPEQELIEADRLLAALAAAKGLPQALADTADPTHGLVLHKSGAFQGPQAIASGLAPAANAGPLFWQADRAFVAKSGEFGSTSGRFVQVLRGEEAQQGRYITVWRKDEQGRWRALSNTIVADPAPALAPAPAAATARPRPVKKRR